MLEQAKKYLNFGWSVIPVGADKRPKLASWKDYQSRLPTVEELTHWFSNPFNNIGVVTGKISGITVLDIDFKNGGQVPQGIPEGLVAKTQSGGRHYYYKYEPSLGNKAGILQGVDIRGDGGFVVAPPSQGVKGKYEWLKKGKLLPFPTEILANTLVPTPKTDWSKQLQGISEGGRNEGMTKIAGKLVKTFPQKDWDTWVWQTLLNYNAQNKPPLDEQELRTIYTSITHLEASKTQVNAENDEIPLVKLSEASKSDIEPNSIYTIPSGFGKLDEVINGGFKPGNLVVIVGESGHGKTTFARNLTKNAMVTSNPSLWFTYELTPRELWEKFKEIGIGTALPIYAPLKSTNRQIDFIRAKIIEAKAKLGCNLVFIDHLGRILGKENKRGNLADDYTKIANELKELAVEQEVVIVLMWHLRKLAQGQKEAGRNDVKDSIGIVQESDLTLSIAKQEAELGGEEDIYSDEVYLKILKNRSTGIEKRIILKYINGLYKE